MTAGTPRCEGCGSALPSASAVCARCEAALTAKAPLPPGKYVCPHCHARFAAPAKVLWPPKLPWWRPTTIRPQCPHCDTPLRDRRQPDVGAWLLPAMFMAALCIQLVVDAPLRTWLALLVLAGPIAYMSWRTERGAPEQDRYAVGTRRRWLRDVRELQQSDRPEEPRR